MPKKLNNGLKPFTWELFFTARKRKAIWAIYVWCRRTDEIMDSLEASTKSQDELSDNLDEWEENTKMYSRKFNLN